MLWLTSTHFHIIQLKCQITLFICHNESAPANLLSHTLLSARAPGSNIKGSQIPLLAQIQTVCVTASLQSQGTFVKMLYASTSSDSKIQLRHGKTLKGSSCAT